jgi:hypothetical protein
MNQLAVRTPTQLATRTKIDRLQDELGLAIENGKIKQTIKDCKKDNDQARHYFGENLYVRSLVIPAGTALVGYIHKQDRVCIIAAGEVTFSDEFLGTKKVKAPWVGEFKAGSKTAVYAHTDTMWVACLGTDSKDKNNMVDKLVVATHEEYDDFLDGDSK